MTLTAELVPHEAPGVTVHPVRRFDLRMDGLVAVHPRVTVLTWLLLAFVATTIAWPFYIALEPIPNAALNPQRLFSVAFAFALLLALLRSRHARTEFGSMVRNHRVFFALFALYFVWRWISGVASGERIAVFMTLYELVTYFCVFIGAYIFLFAANQRSKLIRVVMVATVVVLAICVTELALGRNPLVAFANSTDRMAISAEAIQRTGSIRVKGAFEHPLTLVQYVSMALPLLVIGTANTRYTQFRLLWLVALGAALVATRSRSALVFLGVVGVAYFWGTFVAAGRRGRLLRLAALSAMPIVLVVTFSLSPRLDDLFGRSFMESNAREAQIQNGILAVKESLWVGFGPRANLGVILYEKSMTDRRAQQMWERNSTTVDNWYLSVLLESGLPGFLLFVAFCVVALFTGIAELIKSARILSVRDEWSWLLAVTLACLGALTTMSILSIFTVHAIFYLSLAAMLYSAFALRQMRLANNGTSQRLGNRRCGFVTARDSEARTTALGHGEYRTASFQN